MRAKLTRPYCGSGGVFPAGTVLAENELPPGHLQAMIDAKYADVVGVRKVERAVKQPASETADIKQDAAPKHLGGGWYELADGSRVRGKQAAGL